MNAKWYRGYLVFGNRDDHINRISNLVRRFDLGSVIPCLHVERKTRKGEFYLFIGFNTDKEGYIPEKILEILNSISIGNLLDYYFKFSEIKNFVSAGIDT